MHVVVCLDSVLNEMERQVMDLLLKGDHPVLATLREQAAIVEVTSREFTGVGFFTNFHVPSTAPRLSLAGRFELCDVHADVQGLEHSAGFVLFVQDGILSFLECYIVDEEWPSEAKLVRAYYMCPQSPGSPVVVETDKRDLAWTLRRLPDSGTSSGNGQG